MVSSVAPGSVPHTSAVFRFGTRSTLNFPRHPGRLASGHCCHQLTSRVAVVVADRDDGDGAVHVGMLGWGVGGVLFGKLADDLGARRIILAGTLLMAGGFFGIGLSQNLWQLSLSYGIMVGLAKGACGLVIISLLVASAPGQSPRARR